LKSKLRKIEGYDCLRCVGDETFVGELLTDAGKEALEVLELGFFIFTAAIVMMVGKWCNWF